MFIQEPSYANHNRKEKMRNKYTASWTNWSEWNSESVATSLRCKQYFLYNHFDDWFLVSMFLLIIQNAIKLSQQFWRKLMIMQMYLLFASNFLANKRKYFILGINSVVGKREIKMVRSIETRHFGCFSTNVFYSLHKIRKSKTFGCLREVS